MKQVINKKELKKQIVQKAKEIKQQQRVDYAKAKEQILKAVHESNEKKSLELLNEIIKQVSDKEVSVKELNTLLGDVKQAIIDSKAEFPQVIEVIQNERPEWYREPKDKVEVYGGVELTAPVQLANPVEIAQPVEVYGSVDAKIDWLTFGSILNISFQGLFEFLTRLVKTTFKVMPAQEHYTTPQMMVLTDPKSGLPVDLTEFNKNNQDIVVNAVVGGRVSLKDSLGHSINPATSEKQSDQIALLEDIKANTANIVLNVDTLEVNTDEIEAKIDSQTAVVAKEAKQDTEIAILNALNTLATALNNTVTTNDKMHLLLQQIRDSISMPVDYDETVNARKTLPSGGTIGTVTTVSTVAAVTSVATVANQTNIGGYSADLIAENQSFQDWGISIRSLYI